MELKTRVRGDIAVEQSKTALDLAWAEWETIQKKIDNVSTFPFTIKTWAVAISGALLGLGKGFNLPSATLFVAAAIPILFWVIECKHHRMRDILGRRAIQLEVLIGRLSPLRIPEYCEIPPSLLRAVKRLPGVALAIQRSDEERKRSRCSWKGPENFNVAQRGVRNMRILWQKYVIQFADGIFYSCQLILICAIAAMLALSKPKPSINAEHPQNFCPDHRLFDNPSNGDPIRPLLLPNDAEPSGRLGPHD